MDYCYSKKTKDEMKQIYDLWQICFADPEAFADYYFEHVCKENRIFVAKEGNTIIGMVHLNPYIAMHQGKKEKTIYIVGVAVKQEYRRQGIMRNMLTQVIGDMKKQNIAFSFLMPEKQEYYLSLGYEMVYKNYVYEISIEKANREFCAGLIAENPNNHVLLLSSCNDALLEKIADEMNNKLSLKYDVFLLRNVDYLKKMIMEHGCQQGDAVAVFQNEKLLSVYAFDIYGTTMYIERMELLVEEWIEEDLDFIVWNSVLELAKEKNMDQIILTTSAKTALKLDGFFTKYTKKFDGIIKHKKRDGKGIMALPKACFLKERYFFDEIV